MYIAEAVDAPAAEGVPQQIRRKTEDACAEGLVEVLAEDLATAAVPLLPHCARLEARRYASSVLLLAACSALSGDRAAAAEALNLYNEFEEAWDRGSLDGVDRHFFVDAELVWDGVVVPEGGGDAAALLHARMKGPPRHHLYFEAIEGTDPDRVRATATVSREAMADGAKRGDERATLELLWVRNGDRLWIQRATVGRFEPVADP
jgi:hypothetical protein